MMDEDYGYSNGVKITEELIAIMVAEAEEGYDISKLKPVGRPLNVDGVLEVVPVRMDAELKSALALRAEKDKTTVSAVIRNAVRAYLDVS